MFSFWRKEKSLSSPESLFVAWGSFLSMEQVKGKGVWGTNRTSLNPLLLHSLLSLFFFLCQDNNTSAVLSSQECLGVSDGTQFPRLVRPIVSVLRRGKEEVARVSLHSFTRRQVEEERGDGSTDERRRAGREKSESSIYRYLYCKSKSEWVWGWVWEHSCQAYKTRVSDGLYSEREGEKLFRQPSPEHTWTSTSWENHSHTRQTRKRAKTIIKMMMKGQTFFTRALFSPVTSSSPSLSSPFLYPPSHAWGIQLRNVFM